MTLTTRARTAVAGGLLPLALTACAGAHGTARVVPASSSAPSGTPSGAVTSPVARVTNPPAGSSAPLVVVVSLDGFTPVAMHRTDTPALDRMVARGASTLNARTAYEQTITVPNHTGMMTGQTVAGTGGRPGHRVTFDQDSGGTVADEAGRYVPSIFDVAHDRGLRTALYTSKTKFAFFERSWDATHGARDTTGTDQGRDKIDVFSYGRAASAGADLLAALRSRPASLSFLHVDLPDNAGHASGFLSPAYLAAVRETDAIVGRLLDGIAADPALARRTTVVLTADHGGPEGATSHSNRRLVADYTVPVMAWGRGVTPGADLYALNPGRARPGTGWPTYAGAQPVRNLDVADLALHLLGLPDLPNAGIPGTTRLTVS